MIFTTGKIWHQMCAPSILKKTGDAAGVAGTTKISEVAVADAAAEAVATSKADAAAAAEEARLEAARKAARDFANSKR